MGALFLGTLFAAFLAEGEVVLHGHVAIGAEAAVVAVWRCRGRLLRVITRVKGIGFSFHP